MRLEYYPKIKEEIKNDLINIIKNRKEKYPYPFFFDTKSYIELEKIKKMANQLGVDKIENIIVLGTGGSIQTLLALNHLAKKKVYPINSSRALELKKCLDETNPENSLVIPISRGGETLDVNSTIGIFAEEKYNFLGLSSMGTMNKLLKDMGCPILEVPDLSGRFAGSNTNVGIVPAFLSGINVKAFLEGLEYAYESFSTTDWSFPIEFSIYLYFLYKKGFKVIFSMPYTKNLEESVGLFVQCISESTGKQEKGMIGTFQSAPFCQHSVLEYLLGGTKGVVIPIIWTVNNETPDLILKSSLSYVNGQSAQSIVNYQADATFQALIEQSIPSAKISIDDLSEFNMGSLIAFILTSVYYLCLLIDVNWSTNLKVKLGKDICNEALRNELPLNEREEIRNSIAKEKFKMFFDL